MHLKRKRKPRAKVQEVLRQAIDQTGLREFTSDDIKPIIHTLTPKQISNGLSNMARPESKPEYKLERVGVVGNRTIFKPLWRHTRVKQQKLPLETPKLPTELNYVDIGTAIHRYLEEQALNMAAVKEELAQCKKEHNELVAEYARLNENYIRAQERINELNQAATGLRPVQLHDLQELTKGRV